MGHPDNMGAEGHGALAMRQRRSYVFAVRSFGGLCLAGGRGRVCEGDEGNRWGRVGAPERACQFQELQPLLLARDHEAGQDAMHQSAQ